MLPAAALIATAVLAAPAPAGDRARDRERACGVTAHRLVVRFVEAYNKGDVRRLNRTFAPEPAFQWYSAPGPDARFMAAAEDRASLMPYFAARHRAGDRLRLARFEFNGRDASKDVGHFEMTFRRRTAPAARRRDAPSKGALVCARKQVIVTSLGGR